MSQGKVRHTIARLRRTRKVVEKQLGGRTRDLEKTREFLGEEVSRLKWLEAELEGRLQELAAELKRAKEVHAADVIERARAEDAARRSREELRAFAARLQDLREDERARLAREIHDELSGALAALKMDLSLLPDRASTDQALLFEKLSSMSELIDRTLDRMHRVVAELRPVILDRFGPVSAIEWEAQEFQRRWGIACETYLPSEEIPLDSNRSTAAFRILQEALTNVARHAGAAKVIVALKSEGGSLFLTVHDNGKGIDKTKIFNSESFGLLSMRERVLAFGGQIEVTMPTQGGTLVDVRIPIK